MASIPKLRSGAYPTHAAAVHGLEISPEGVDLARVALKRLGLIGEGAERDRRPTTAELSRLFRCFDENVRLTMPMTRIVQFAIATHARRQSSNTAIASFARAAEPGTGQ